jgi:hypothetical protein
MYSAHFLENAKCLAFGTDHFCAARPLEYSWIHWGWKIPDDAHAE